MNGFTLRFVITQHQTATRKRHHGPYCKLTSSGRFVSINQPIVNEKFSVFLCATRETCLTTRFQDSEIRKTAVCFAPQNEHEQRLLRVPVFVAGWEITSRDQSASRVTAKKFSIGLCGRGRFSCVPGFSNNRAYSNTSEDFQGHDIDITWSPLIPTLQLLYSI